MANQKRKYIRYATADKVKRINPDNIEIMKKYFNHKGSNLSDASITNYKSDFNQFFVFLLENEDNRSILDIMEIDERKNRRGTNHHEYVDEMVDILEEYITFCGTTLANKERRIQRRMASISSLFLFLKRKRILKENPVEYLERPKVGAGEKQVLKKVFLTEDEVEKIREGLDELNDLQLKLYFELSISTMARVNAINSIRLEQIDFEKNLINDVIEKEGYNVTLFPSKKTMELINEWIEYREENDIKSDYLFVNKYNGEWVQVSKATMQTTWVKKIGEIIDEPDITAHTFRRSGATLLYNRGMSLEKISKLLNHKTTDITKTHYIKENEESLKEEKEKFEF